VEKVNFKRKKFREELESKSKVTKSYYDRNARPRNDFKKRDKIVYRNKKQWQPAIIANKHKSPRSYLIDTGSNILRRNSNHFRKSVIKHKTNTELDNELPETSINQDSDNHSNNTQDNTIDISNNNNNVKDDSLKENEKPIRARKVPSKFNDYILY